MKNAVKSSGTPSPPRCGWVGEKYRTFRLNRLKTVLFQHGTRQDKLTGDKSCKPKVAQQQSLAIQVQSLNKAHQPPHITLVVTLTPCKCSLPTRPKDDLSLPARIRPSNSSCARQTAT